MVASEEVTPCRMVASWPQIGADDSGQILPSCRHGVGANGVLLVIDRLLPDRLA